MSKAGKAIPPVEQIVNRLDDIGRTRESGTFRSQPSLKIGQQRRTSHPADPQPLLGAQPIDLALDLEQLVNPPDRFQRQGRDRGRRPSTARVLGDIGQFEERPPAVRPAEGVAGDALRPGSNRALKPL